MSTFTAWQADLFLLVRPITQGLYACFDDILGALARRLAAIR